MVLAVLGLLGFHSYCPYGNYSGTTMMRSKVVLRCSDRSQVAMRLTFAHIVHTVVRYPEFMYDYGLKWPLNYDALDFTRFLKIVTTLPVSKLSAYVPKYLSVQSGGPPMRP